MADTASDNYADEAAARIRRAYVAACRSYLRDRLYGRGRIPRWDGGRDRNGRNYKPVWPELAVFFVSNGYDPERMISLCFNNWQQSRPPTPRDLMSDWAVHKYKKSESTESSVEVTTLKRRFASYFDELKSRIACELSLTSATGRTNEQVAETLLLDIVSYRASPLFRYCMASELSLPKVAEAFLAEALEEYVHNRQVYEAAWGAVIPDALRNQANDLVNAIYKTTGTHNA